MPDASKDFIQTEVLKNSAQFSQLEADRPRNFRGAELGVKEMMKSENEIEEEVFNVKPSQILRGELKDKRKQKFDERSDITRRPEGNEGSSTNVLNDDGSGDNPQQFGAFTDSKMTNTLLSESSLSKGP